MAEECTRTMSRWHVYDIRDADHRPYIACLCGRRPSADEVAGSVVIREMQAKIRREEAPDALGDAEIDYAIANLEEMIGEARELVYELEDAHTA